MLVEPPPGSKVITQHKVDGVVVSHGVTEIASFAIEPWTPGQQVDMLMEIELEVEITEMTAERPWGSLDKRLTALHHAVFEYVEGLAAYALGWTEPITDENLPTREDATHS
jgi:hypothetical protein